MEYEIFLKFLNTIFFNEVSQIILRYIACEKCHKTKYLCLSCEIHVCSECSHYCIFQPGLRYYIIDDFIGQKPRILFNKFSSEIVITYTKMEEKPQKKNKNLKFIKNPKLYGNFKTICR